MPNLLKTSYVNISNKDKRVIDMNALMEAKLEKMRREQEEAAQASFVAGLDAEYIDGEEYPGEEGGYEEGQYPEGVVSAEGEIEGTGEEGEEGQPKKPAKAFRPGIARPAVDTAAIIEKANREAESIIEEANQKAQQIIEQAREDAENTKQGVYEEARGLGYEDGKQSAQDELDAAVASLNEQARQLEENYTAMYESVEADLVETITDIYQYIFDVDLSGQRQILLHLIEGTMRKIEGTKSFLVHVSPEDSAYVNMQKKNLEAAATLPESIVEVIEDISLSKNQCYIETDGGIFDCGLDTELSELTAKLRLLSYEKNKE